MPSNTSVFRGRNQETYFAKALPGGTTTLLTTEALCTTLEFTASAGASAYTVVLPVGSEDAGLRWWIYPNIAGPTLFQIASPNTPASYTLELPLGVRSNVLWTGAGWALLDASGAVADAARNGIPEDGVTDATIALRSLLATGVPVRLTRGTTYFVSGTLPMSTAGQTLFLNGATIKRAAQVSTTITGTVTANTTTVIPVTSTTGFFIGQSVSLTKAGTLNQIFVVNGGTGYTLAPTVTISDGGGTGGAATATVSGGTITSFTITNAGSGYITSPTVVLSGGGGTGASVIVRLNTTDPTNTDRTITAIGASTITVSGTFNQSFVSGNTFYTCGWTVNLAAAGCRLQGPGTIDGNKSAFTYVRWPSCNEARISAGDGVIDGITIQNAVSEGIYVNADYARVVNNAISACNGNGVHFSGAAPGTSCLHPLVQGNRITDCNLDTSAAHADGCITWSNTIVDGTVRDNYLAGGLAGIGSIDSNDNSDVTVSGNTIRNCLPNAIRISTSAANDPLNLLFDGNRIYSSGLVRFANDSGSATAFPGKLIFSNNILVSTKLLMTRVKWCEIRGNILDGTGDTTGIGIQAANLVEHALIVGNTVMGWGTGISVDSAAGKANISVLGNQCLLNQTTGILVDSTGILGLLVANNRVMNDTTSATGFVGIQAKAGEVRGNTVNITKGAHGIFQNASYSIVEHNTVRSVGATDSINIATGTTGCITRDNTITGTLTDLGDGLHTAGNITIT